jgi:error-prone DNA polymerase
VNFSVWDCALEGEKGELRLGMRLVRGLAREEATRIAGAVQQHGQFHSLEKLWRASGVRAYTLKLLARADAFTSCGVSRQQALWSIQRFRDEVLPLFEKSEERESPSVLPPVTLPAQVIKDYHHTGLSLKAHPLSFLRAALKRSGAATAAELADQASGKRAAIAGLVLVRQRPPTASGVCFMTIEDETGSANLVVFPQVFAEFRAALCESVVVYVVGRVQKEDGVIHLAVDYAQGIDAGPELELSRDFH